MRKVQHYCEKCGKPIDLKGQLIRATVQQQSVTMRKYWRNDEPVETVKQRQVMPQMLFCVECGKGVADALRAYAEGVSE